MNLLRLVLSALLIGPSSFAAENQGSCDDVLLLQNPMTLGMSIEELKAALDEVPGSTAIRERSWYQLLADYSRASEGEDNLLVVSLVGGGNAGKSTLFNSLSSLISGTRNYLIDQPLSRVGHFPGLTQRMIVAVSPHSPNWVSAELRRRFGHLDTWTHVDESKTPGNGLLVQREHVPNQIAFIDSPDFDTGNALTYEPDNLRRALRVIYPSDVLAVLVDSRTVRNQANVKLLNSAFRLYGKKKLIMIFLADPAIPAAEIQDLLQSLAQSIYGTQGSQFPDGVLGAYIMPYSGAVAAGRELTSLNPLPGFREFPRLVEHMGQAAAEIKRYSQHSAINTIIQGAHELLRGHQKRLMAMKIYERALKVAARTSGLQSVGDFQYMEVREVLRNKFRNFDGQLRSLIYQFGNVTAIPDRLLLNLVQHFRPTAIISKRLAADHKTHDRLAVTQMLSALQTQRIPLLDKPDEAMRDLRAASLEFFEMFPEEEPEHGDGQIALPSINLLPEQVRREYRNLLNADSEALIERLSGLIDSVQFDPRENLSRHDLNSVLGRVHHQQGKLRQLTVGLLDLGTIGAPAGAGYWLMQHGIDNTWIWLAVIVGSSRPLRWWSDHMVDTYLQNQINNWYHSLQLEATELFFTDTVSGALRAALAREITIYEGPQFRRLELALESVKHELGRSN